MAGLEAVDLRDGARQDDAHRVGHVVLLEGADDRLVDDLSRALDDAVRLRKGRLFGPSGFFFLGAFIFTPDVGLLRGLGLLRDGAPPTLRKKYRIRTRRGAQRRAPAETVRPGVCLAYVGRVDIKMTVFGDVIPCGRRGCPPKAGQKPGRCARRRPGGP